MVGGLVEDEAAASPAVRSARSARFRSPVTGPRRGRPYGRRVEAELGELGPGLAAVEQAGPQEQEASRSGPSVASPPGADPTSRTSPPVRPYAGLRSADVAQEGPEYASSCRCRSAPDGEAVLLLHLEVDRAEPKGAPVHDCPVQAGHDCASAGPPSRKLQVELPPLPRLVDRVEALDRPCRGLAFDAFFSRALTVPMERMNLSFSLLFLRLGVLALLRPRPAGFAAGSHRAGERAVPLSCRRASDWRRPGPRAATVVRSTLPACSTASGRRRRSSSMRATAPVEEPVVRDRHHGGRRRSHVLLEPPEAREVEVVRGLVEEEHVVPGQQDGREGGAPPARRTGDRPAPRRGPRGGRGRPARRRCGRRGRRPRRPGKRPRASV